MHCPLRETCSDHADTYPGSLTPQLSPLRYRIVATENAEATELGANFSVASVTSVAIPVQNEPANCRLHTDRS